MDNDLRITLIATGFASKTGLTETSQDDEQIEFLKRLKSEEQLDVPSFLRRPLFSHRRQAQIPSTKLVQTPSQTSVH
jgi:cell division protein FtsZ